MTEIVGGTGDGSGRRPAGQKAAYAKKVAPAKALHTRRHSAQAAKPADQKILRGSSEESKQVVKPHDDIPMVDFKDF